MKQKLLLMLIAIVALSMPAAAQRLTAAWAFSTVPPVLLPSIDPSVRLDMVDYANNGLDKFSANELDGKCRITEITPTHLVATTSDVSTWELDLLPYRGDTIYMVLSTVRTPAPDTRVSFYTRDWKALNAPLFKSPVLADYHAGVRLSADQLADIGNAVPFVMQHIVYDPERREMTVTNSFAEYVPEDEFARVVKYLRPSLTYRYNGKRFVKK